MTEPNAASRHLVDEFFRALADRDPAFANAVLAENVVGTVPYSLSGSTDPQQVFEGKEAVLGYLAVILENFDNAALRDREVTVSTDGAIVFVEATGALIAKRTGDAYRNRYVFRFRIVDERIVEIREYANPVTYAQAMGLPVG